jgi:anti-sigma regulatory factor (Ser/Thr protein kinase)
VGRDDLVASAAYQPAPTAAAAARHFVRDTLQEWLLPGAAADRRELVDDAVLLTSELVTNAVVHARTPVQVTCRLAGPTVEVMVSDGHPARLVPVLSERRSAEGTSGRGLLLPAALACEWGVTYGRTAKGVWFRLGLAGAGAGLGTVAADGGGAGLYEELEAATGARAALSAALHAFGGTGSAGAAAGAPGQQAQPGRGGGSRAATPPAKCADPGYRVLLARTVEAARVTVRADAAFAFMADEDGDLCLQAAAGTMPPSMDRIAASAIAGSGGASLAAVRASTGVAPSVVTVPFVVDGRVTGLLAAASARQGRFNEEETGRLQRLADTWGGPLQRAWLFEIARIRRGRIAAIAAASRLLAGGLGREEVLSTAGRAVVPGLAAWCAVLMRAADGGLRTAYARHSDGSRTAALTWLLDQTCEAAPAASSWLARGRAPGRRWPLPVPDASGAPAQAGEFSADVAWSFPLGHTDGSAGVFVIGRGGEGRLPREVAALATDVAFRIGFALGGAPPAGKRVPPDPPR